MKTDTTPLEEQVVLLAKIVESFATSTREKDNQIASMMEKIKNLIKKTSVALSQNQH